MPSNYDLPLTNKLVWTAACIGILLASPVLFVAELLWTKDSARDILKSYDNEVLSMVSTLKSMWIDDDDDFDYGAYA